MITFFVIAGGVASVSAFMLCKSLRVPPSEVKDDPEPPAKPLPPSPLPQARIIDPDRRGSARTR